MKEKQTGNFYEQSPKMAKKTLTGPGLEPETSGLMYQRSIFHLFELYELDKFTGTAASQILGLDSWHVDGIALSFIRSNFTLDVWGSRLGPVIVRPLPILKLN